MDGQLVHFEIPAQDGARASGVLEVALRLEVPEPGKGRSEYHMLGGERARRGDLSRIPIPPAPGRSSTSAPRTSTRRLQRRASSAGRRTTSSRSRPSAGLRAAWTPKATAFSLFQADESVPAPARASRRVAAPGRTAPTRSQARPRSRLPRARRRRGPGRCRGPSSRPRPRPVRCRAGVRRAAAGRRSCRRFRPSGGRSEAPRRAVRRRSFSS